MTATRIMTLSSENGNGARREGAKNQQEELPIAIFLSRSTKMSREGKNRCGVEQKFNYMNLHFFSEFVR